MQSLDFDPSQLTKASEFNLIPEHQEQTIDPLLMMHQNAPSVNDANFQMQMQYNQAAMMMSAMPNVHSNPQMMMNAPYLSPPNESWPVMDVKQQHQQLRRQSVPVIDNHRDERTIRKRRASHRDVERRRREHINDSIASLAELMGLDRESHNKGSILSAAVQYVREQQNKVEALKQQVSDLSTLQ